MLIRGDEVHAFELAQRLRRAIEDTTVTVRGGQLASTTVSAGIATYPNGASGEEELVERSDDALYESKRAGRNRVSRFQGVQIGMAGAAEAELAPPNRPR